MTVLIADSIIPGRRTLPAGFERLLKEQVFPGTPLVVKAMHPHRQPNSVRRGPGAARPAPGADCAFHCLRNLEYVLRTVPAVEDIRRGRYPPEWEQLSRFMAEPPESGELRQPLITLCRELVSAADAEVPELAKRKVLERLARKGGLPFFDRPRDPKRRR